MVSETGKTVTELLRQIRAGDRTAGEKLLPLLYDQLRDVAKNFIGRERPGHTWGATGLVHEAYLRLFDGSLPEIADRSQFFAYAARTMRNLLVDHARKKRAVRRGGDRQREDLDVVLERELQQFERDNRVELLALHEALDQLMNTHPRQHEVAMLRTFGGHTVAEVAELLGISTTTVDKDWKVARAHLLLLMTESEQSGDVAQSKRG